MWLQTKGQERRAHRRHRPYLALYLLICVYSSPQRTNYNIIETIKRRNPNRETIQLPNVRRVHVLVSIIEPLCAATVFLARKMWKLFLYSTISLGNRNYTLILPQHRSVGTAKPLYGAGAACLPSQSEKWHRQFLPPETRFHAVKFF